MSFLTLRNLQKTFPDGTRAVTGIDLDIAKGELIVLLGPSGCGKTTTLRMIAGLEAPTSGSITLAGNAVTHLPPSQRDVGFVFQFYALYPHMTVRQNIAFPLENTGTSRPDIEAEISRVARALDIEMLLDRHPGMLSGGDRQRVSLARAMVRKPDVYLMDEPLGTLDAEHRLALREFIRTQQLALSITAIYVTHDQEEAMNLADRIAVMADGEIRQIGTPSDIYRHPADLFVANFVGRPGMNLLRGEVVQKDSKKFFTKKTASLPVPHETPVGKTVLGIRPEYVQPSAQGIEAETVLSEYQGGHRLIHLETPLGNLVMRTPVGAEPNVQEMRYIQLSPAHICIFDAETGKAI